MVEFSSEAFAFDYVNEKSGPVYHLPLRRFVQLSETASISSAYDADHRFVETVRFESET
jgi:hypothetical protein